MEEENETGKRFGLCNRVGVDDPDDEKQALTQEEEGVTPPHR